MNFVSAAHAALQRLVLDGGDANDLTRLLDELQQSMTAMVASFLGLRLVIDLGGHPVVLTTLEDASLASVVTSLRWSGPDGEPSSTTFTLYAGRRGAFVDLAADIAWSARQPGSDEAPDRLRLGGVELDRDLTPAALAPGLAGLDQFTLVNRAQGVLIDQGVAPEHAMAELTRRAAAAGADLVGHARDVVRGVHRDPDGRARSVAP